MPNIILANVPPEEITASRLMPGEDFSSTACESQISASSSGKRKATPSHLPSLRRRDELYTTFGKKGHRRMIPPSGSTQSTGSQERCRRGHHSTSFLAGKPLFELLDIPTLIEVTLNRCFVPEWEFLLGDVHWTLRDRCARWTS